MYITNSTIVGLEETATEPITISVTQDFMDLVMLPPDTPTRFGDKEPLYITKDTTGANKHIPDILNTELIVVRTETTGPEYSSNITTIASSTKNIYSDTDINSSISPILNRRRLSFSMTYYSKSKSDVTRVVNRIRAISDDDAGYKYHDLEYFYYVPEIVIELLDNLNTLKNTHTTPLIDLDSYIANTFDTKATIVNSETGNPYKLKLAIREKQLSVLGVIDSDMDALVPEYDENSNRWYLSLDYSIEYELPNQLLVIYPIVVYNQPIPAKFRIDPRKLPQYVGERTYLNDGMSRATKIEAGLLRIPTDTYYLKIPPQDMLELPIPVIGYVRLFSVLSIITTTDLQTLFYLDEIPNISFNPDVIELIKLEASRMGDTHASLFYMDIFNYNAPAYGVSVVVNIVTENVSGVLTERVKITSSTPLDIHGCYRVSFSVLSDVAMMRTGTFRMLTDNIVTVDSNSGTGFSVLDTVLSIFNLDISKLRTGFAITDNTTSLDIAMNIDNTLWNRMFTRQTSMVLTEMLKLK